MKVLLKYLALSVSLSYLIPASSASELMPLLYESNQEIEHHSYCSDNLGLENLPDEMLVHIAAFLVEEKSYKALEDFSLTCTRLHGVGEEVLQKVVLQEPQALIKKESDQNRISNPIFSPAKMTSDARRVLFAVAENRGINKAVLEKLRDHFSEVNHPAKYLLGAIGAKDMEAYNGFEQKFHLSMEAKIAMDEAQALELSLILHGLGASFTSSFKRWCVTQTRVLEFPKDLDKIFQYSKTLRNQGFSKVFETLMDNFTVDELTTLGRQYFSAQDFDMAKQLYEKAAQKDPSQLNNLAWIHFNLHDLKKAKQLLELSIQKTENPAAHILIGRLYKEENNIAQAEEYYKLALALGDNRAEYWLGVLYEHEGDLTTAYRYYNASAYKGHEKAKDALEKLKNANLS